MNVEAPGDETVRSPDPSKTKTLEVIKSQKNLNSATYFNVHEQEPRQEAEKRSTRIEKTEMRQTWKRPRVPHHKKLDGFIQYNNKPAARSLAKDIVQKINMMQENNQYKYAQQFLSPLKLEQKKKKQLDDNRSKQERKESMNPFLPVKNHIKLAKEIKDRLDRDMQDMSIERVRALKTHMSLPSFKLEEFVTVQIVKRSQNTGAVKKMLHVPTMKLYVIKEQPIATKESRNSIVEWIGQWQTRICEAGAEHCDTNPFIKVYSNFWYYPEGSVSILSEYCEGGSLQDLLGSVDTLPENVIKQICAPLLKTLNLFYSASEGAFGGLSTSQIMFTETGQFKINMGLFYRGSPLLSSNIFNTRGSIQKPNLFEANNAKIWAKWSNADRTSNNVEVERAIDVFKIGLILLQCSIGSFEIYDQSSVLFDNIKVLLSDSGQKAIEKQANLCCILHSEDFVLNFNSSERRERIDTTKIFKYMTFLKNRFSGQFISFLCSSLKLQHKKRAKMPELATHAFVQTPSQARTVRVTLVELLKISRGWCQQTPSIELLDKKIEKLCDSISIVLANCRKDYLYELKHLDKDRIARLAKQLGVREEVLYRRFDGLLRDLQDRNLH